MPWQRGFRDGAFRQVVDGGVTLTAGVTAVGNPNLAARFLSVSKKIENHRYGLHPRQVQKTIVLVLPSND